MTLFYNQEPPISHYGINRNDWMGCIGLCPHVGGTGACRQETER